MLKILMLQWQCIPEQIIAIIVRKRQDVYCKDAEMKKTITDSQSFKLKSRFTNNTDRDDNMDEEIALPLKHEKHFGELL